jgi:hypothetical protein
MLVLSCYLLTTCDIPSLFCSDGVESVQLRCCLVRICSKCHCRNPTLLSFAYTACRVELHLAGLAACVLGCTWHPSVYRQIKFSWLRLSGMAWKEGAHSEEHHWTHVQSAVVILGPVGLKEKSTFRYNFRNFSLKVSEFVISNINSCRY